MSFSDNAVVRMQQIAEASSSPADCKREILKHLSDIDLKVFHSQVLVAHYVRPVKTKGNIILPGKTVQEDRYQGNCFLVISKGKGAFKDDNIAQFNGDTIKVGDWVMAQASDGIAMDIKGMPCRLYSDTRILMKVADPSQYN